MRRRVKVLVFFMATVLCPVLTAYPAPAASGLPSVDDTGLLVFKMMILTAEEGGIGRAKGQVTVTTEDREPTLHPLDQAGVFSFTIPFGTTSRAAFSGEFIPYALRFEFQDGFLSVFNDALPADQQEARLPYYCNIDGTYVVEYRQDYLYMLAPADEGAFILGRNYTRIPELPYGFAEEYNTPGLPDDQPEVVAPIREPPWDFHKRMCYFFQARTTIDLDFFYRILLYIGELQRKLGPYFEIDSLFMACNWMYPRDAALIERDDTEREVPTLEVCVIKPDRTVSFLEWLPLGATGEIENVLQWSADFVDDIEGFVMTISFNIDMDYLDSLPRGVNTLAYRVINSQGAASNYRLLNLDIRD